MPFTTKQFYRLMHHFGYSKVAHKGEDRVVESSPRIRRSGYIRFCQVDRLRCLYLKENAASLLLCNMSCSWTESIWHVYSPRIDKYIFCSCTPSGLQ